MLTKITIRNFKKFGESEIPLGNGFVFVGPNNSRKTTALQALTLWRAGLDAWNKKGASGRRKYGVTINRKDLAFLPTTHANDLWRNRKVGGHERIRIDLIVEGNDNGKSWKCGLEFEYSGPETFYCRPLREDKTGKKRMEIPEQANNVHIVLLPPMSGLMDTEPSIEPGRINVLLGQGRTAEVLRNVCYRVFQQEGENWNKLKKNMNEFFRVELEDPVFNKATGDITCRYKQAGILLDLQSAGRGMQQIMLLLAFFYYHEKGTVFLMDEPDAHLETLRQQQIYRRLRDIAYEQNSQIIVASHSEKLLDEAGRHDSAVVFLGKSPKILGSGKMEEVKKSLSEIGHNDYYHAELKKWVLYLEGAYDLDILIAFANRLNHPAVSVLDSDTLFYHLIGTDHGKAKYGHFSALNLAVPELVGIMITDHKPTNDQQPKGLKHIAWERREIENYLCTPATLIGYAGKGELDMFAKKRRETMEEEIEETERSLKKVNEKSMFAPESKASERMEALFKNYADTEKTLLLTKKDFHQLVGFISDEDINPEIIEKLDAICETAPSAKTEDD